jgi:hypothetical protein
MINLTPNQLRQAANLKEKIVALEKELNQLFGSTVKPVASPAPKKRRKMSAAGRARLVAAVKARWAEVEASRDLKKASRENKKKRLKKVKRKMSAAARAKISAAAKARWAKYRAAKK